ncbi:NAD-dependent epimerase/dehydratase family protein [Paractinoplanes ferrugineus]|uniref:NAD-dependent epimerase/dehydratase family protein n=1 Tax=Paractinoplanes ferrugineus TaxID=113564 RepID=UPI001942D495|nr:NAD(P)H-binding protein [Actinoplanes ferrugineus]
MRILVVGGSGLIGAHVTEVLRERGHEVTTAARSPGAGVDHLLDVTDASVDAMRGLLTGHDGVVFATRTDEQRPLPRPILGRFRRDMVEPVVRLFTAARQEGLTRGVLLGSYYTYFDRVRPQWRLAERHTYVRCRVEQAREGRAAAGPDLPVAVIELPFVLGRAGERGPNWAAPFERWARSGAPLLVPAGGTAVVTARNVAGSVAEALEHGGGADLPVADANLSWAEMMTRVASAAGRARPVRRLPAGVLRAAFGAGAAVQTLLRQESGLDLGHLADLMLADLFVEPVSGRPLDAAFRESFSAPG